TGAARFGEVAERWRELAAEAISEASSTVPGTGEDVRAGPLVVGGFAFAADGGHAPHWNGFDPASLTVPELVLARSSSSGRTTVQLTLTASACADDTPEALLERLCGRVAELRHRALPLLDPAPSSPSVVVSAMPPEHYG